MARTRLVAFGIGTALALTAASTSVRAADALGCVTDARTQRAYQAGYRSGGSLVDQAFAATRGCEDLADVERTVRDTLARYDVPAGASVYVQCRVGGVRDGAADRLDALRTSCGC